MTDGRLLKPGVPGMSLDSMFYQRAYKDDKYPNG